MPKSRTTLARMAAALRGRARHDRNEDGFTLVELLVVVIIIGVLAAIAVPTFLSNRGSASNSAIETTGKNILNAAYLFATQNATTPARGATLIAAYNDLPVDIQPTVGILAGTTDNVPTSMSPISPDQTYGDGANLVGLAVVVQRQGEFSARAGCIWLPPPLIGGHKPVFFPHGTAIADTLEWPAPDGSMVTIVTQGEFVDVTSQGCTATEAPGQIEGVYNGENATNPVVDFGGGAQLAFAAPDQS